MPIFTPIPHERFVDHVMTLAALIGADGWVPSYLIGIGRGGLVPATFLSHACGLPMLSVDYSSQVEEFADGALARLAARTRNGDRLLFVDDINDTGGTIGRLRTILADQGAAEGSIRFATLIDNIRSAQRVEYHAETIDRAVTKDWFVFPWEAVAPRATLVEDAAAVPERTA
ncbi:MULTISPECIES: phosphoribosyltransferase [unclassified Sphingomonas]|uniref:phosphoribosyltransferase n=1 Tax=unclassified Sphingomonas TaxID=196159 RepID=UPI000BD9409C|nr:MAG: phosphoribosyltransferase [Sphingomonas sp. 12-62-6]OYX40742.1 MAG: phosphoribosyltransferase [Sphingomonas sp. 32-62-10]OYY63916.1 MAG: phosphoribosyltransferase [Sphingomonas sp. 28-62-11]